VQGVKLEDYLHVAQVSNGKGAIEIGGRSVPVSEIRRLVNQFGIDSGGQFKEGIKSWLDAGRKIESDRKMVRAAGGVKGASEKAINILREGGERGENLTRRALFINRLKQGYSPAAAALEVEKYLFDFTRTSKPMDALRRFWDPFFQHAYKTLLITPEMMMKAPGKYNFLHNNLMQAVEAGINDPVSAEEVKMIIPPYRQIQDPVVGPILTGNSWLRRIFENKTAIDNPGQLGGKTAMLLKMPIGADILNRFAIWNDTLGKTGGLASPLMVSFGMVAFGRDPFSGKLLDPTTQSADMARRFNYAMNSALETMTTMPETMKFAKQQLGIGDPKYMTPNGVLLLHAALGKFVTVTNLDKEYFFRMLSFNKARGELQKALVSTAANEMAGKTADLQVSDQPYLKKIKDFVNASEGSAYLYNKMLQNNRDATAMRDAGAGLSGQMSTSDIVKHIKDLDKHIEALGQQYEATQAYRLQQLKNSKPAEIQQLAPGSTPQRAPQSISKPQGNGDYIDPDDFNSNIARVLRNPKLSQEDKLDRLDDMQQDLDDLQPKEDGSGELGQEEYDRLSSLLQTNIQEMNSQREKSPEELAIDRKNEAYLAKQDVPSGRPTRDDGAAKGKLPSLRTHKGTAAELKALKRSKSGSFKID
jgi:hypothetical protein